MYDWSNVDAGIYHDFYLGWLSTLCNSLNSNLPSTHYGIIEEVGQKVGSGVSEPDALPRSSESASQFYRRKQKNVVIRHVSGDEVVAMIELVSPGNKSSQYHLSVFVEKACELIQRQIHLLIVDPFPPSKRDPQGIHGAIWESLVDESFLLPTNRPLTLVSYECFNATRAYIEPFAVGEPLPDMPLYLAPEAYIDVPLEATYQAAWANVPQRWQREIAATPATPR